MRALANWMPRNSLWRKLKGLIRRRRLAPRLTGISGAPRGQGSAPLVPACVRAALLPPSTSPSARSLSPRDPRVWPSIRTPHSSFSSAAPFEVQLQSAPFCLFTTPRPPTSPHGFSKVQRPPESRIAPRSPQRFAHSDPFKPNKTKKPSNTPFCDSRRRRCPLCFEQPWFGAAFVDPR